MSEMLNKPGCFGSPSVYTAESTHCMRCPAYKECGGASMDTLERIRGLVDVQDLIKKHKTARQKAMKDSVKKESDDKKAMWEQSAKSLADDENINPIQRTSQRVKVSFDGETLKTESLGDEPKTIAAKIINTNALKVARESLKNGVNPFAPTRHKLLVSAGELLLAGGFTKTDLVKICVDDMGWPVAQAQLTVQILMFVLDKSGVTTIVNDKHTIKG